MIFTYNDTYKAYFNNKKSPISMNLSDNLSNLNEEIEIIEENNSIKRLEIKEKNNKVLLKTDNDTGYIVRVVDICLINKINELIEVVNKLKEKMD